ncbi:MAG TPA: hypothetical protein VE999_12150 [Gemmataceae bacterium]|nr:hypothetical protein [Gemmataceae bacterium]
MQADPVVAEIREIRERRAARFGYDIRAIVKDAQARDAVGDRKVVRLPPRRPLRISPKVAEALTNE